MDLEREQILKYLQSLSPQELADLLKELPVSWGISVSPLPFVGGGFFVVHGTPEATMPFEETFQYAVTITNLGWDRVKVIRILRAFHPEWTLFETRRKVGGLMPVTVASGLTKERAKELVEALQGVGCGAILVQ